MRTLGLAACAAVLACSGGSGGNPGSGGSGTTGTAGTTGAAGTTGTSGATGSAGTTGSAGSTGAGNSFEPMSLNAKWVYDTTEVGDGGVGTVAGTKTVTVEASEPVPMRPAITAWRIETHVPNMEDQVTWQAEMANAIVRYRDEVYAPGNVTATGLLSVATYAQYKLRMDTSAAHIATGVTYTESYTETVMDGTGTSTSSKPFGWKVINGAESIAVPAGTFTAVHLQKSNGNSGAIDKDYWFVRGVGKVKETSNAGRLEVLKEFNIP